MKVDLFEIPGELAALIKSGVWPRSHTESLHQNLCSIFTPDTVRRFAPDEQTIYLYSPPFNTVADHLASEKGLSAVQQAVWDIDPSLTLIIADFGLGSDTALALDYRGSPTNPQVIRLQWRLPSESNRWVQVAPSFAEFWAMLVIQREQPIVGA